MTITKNGAPLKDVAVYIDYENLYVSLKSTVKMEPDFDVIMEKCREFGRVTVSRAYADWSEFSRVLTSQMFANGFEPIYVPTRKFYDAKTRAEARKNSVDIHITIDIIKSLFLHENVDVFIIISGDRDYVPLINQIRQQGKEVYALGVAGCTSSELSVAVDEMFYYHQLLESGEERREPHDVYNMLVRAVMTARRRGYSTTLGILKPIMKELVQGFNERNYKNARGNPFQKFKDLVLEAQRRRLVRLVTSGSTNEVYLWGEGVPEQPAAVAQPAETRPREQRGRERRPTRSRGHEDAGRPPAEPSTSTASPEQTAEPPQAASPVSVSVTESASEDLQATRTPETAPATLQRPLDEPLEPAPADAAQQQAPAGDSESEHHHEAPPVSPQEERWPHLLRALDSFGSRPPSPRKLVNQLKKMRDSGELWGADSSDDELQELVKHWLEEGRLEKVSRGFATIVRLKQPADA
jgi:uncharacterized LabA/DUF88 family protein